MPRFFIPAPALSDGRALLTGADARHVAASLRMKAGETLTLCDGVGFDYLCRIDELSPQAVALTVLEKIPSSVEPTIDVTLFVAWPKADKMEWVVQKAVELGAAAVSPFFSARCVSRPDEKSMQKKIERLSKIAAEAAMQSGRGRLPAVTAPYPSFHAAAEAAGRADRALFCYENEQERGLSEALAPPFRTMALMTGPEGGFAPEEVETARAAGLLSVSLGPRILRCETAPMAALCAAMLMTGNFSPISQR